MISEKFRLDTNEPKNKLKNNSITSIKRMTNRNPNCNHNNSRYFNSQLLNIKVDKGFNPEEKKDDLIWKNSELYSENEEIEAVASLLYKLFSNPKLGEVCEKKKTKPKTIIGKLKT